MKLGCLAVDRLGRAMIALVACGFAAAGSAAQAQEASGQATAHADDHAAAPLFLRIAGQPESSIIGWTGQQEVHDTYTLWRPMCGSNAAGWTTDTLKHIAEDHAAKMADQANIVTIDTPRTGTRAGGINIVFNINASGAPAGYQTAFTAAEAYLEAQFADPITITINVSWASLGSGILGATGSNYQSGVSWATSRTMLVNSMGADDVIQAFLPTGSTIPVRFTGSSATITNVSTVDWTRGNYKAAGGGLSGGTEGNMQLSTNFSWDFDSSNGVGGGLVPLTDVLVHEVTHALGFVSVVDQQATSFINPLDAFRFARSTRSGISNTNPTTNADFQTFAREVSFNNPTNDDANTDLVSAEYRMSDGSPWQASHFYEQGSTYASSIGIMEPAISNGTFYPNYYKASDKNVMSALGYDTTPPCTPPTITTHPSSQTVCQSTPLTLSVAATSVNGAITYQWTKGGSTIAGATSSTYNVASAATSDAGSYACNVTDSCTTVTSNAATVSVLLQPAFTTQPTSRSVCSGNNTTFTVAANGSPGFQWRKNGIDISGATATSYTITGVTIADAANYDCVATNFCNAVTSNTAVLTVNVVPTITGQPTPQAACAGSNATFSVAANNATGYQWRKGGSNISGANSSSYTILGAGAGDVASYTCLVSSPCGSVLSNAAAFTLNSGPSISGHPASQNVCEGLPASFSVTASGSPTYQWRKNSSNIPGANASVYSIASASSSDDGTYDCVVTNACSSATSNPATLDVGAGPGITTQPAGGSFSLGAPISLTVAANGSAPLSYQWRKGGSPLSDTASLTGSLTGTLTIASAASSDAGSYDCVVTNPCGEATSNAALVSIGGCPADLDDGSGTGTPDGGIDINDLLFFLASYEAGDVAADLDDGSGAGTPDGGVDINDLLFFLGHYEAGC